MSTVLVEPSAVHMETLSLPKAEPCVTVIFGATGDLTRRKLMPALWDLKNEGCLENVQILGVGRSAMSDDEYREFVHQALVEHANLSERDDEEWRKFAQRVNYITGELDDDNTYLNTAK